MLKKTLMILLLNASLISSVNASNISYLIKNDNEVESYLKIKNNKESVYLKLYCNNFYNDIKVSLRGVNEKDFYSKNFFESKVIFGKEFTKSNWKSTYTKEGVFYLELQDQGFSFAENLYKNGKVLIDLPELKEFKLYSTNNKSLLQKKMSLIFENCSIYF